MEGTVLESLALHAEELALEGAGVESSAFVGAASSLRPLASVDTAHRALGRSCQSWNAGRWEHISNLLGWSRKIPIREHWLSVKEAFFVSR